MRNSMQSLTCSLSGLTGPWCMPACNLTRQCSTTQLPKLKWCSVTLMPGLQTIQTPTWRDGWSTDIIVKTLNHFVGLCINMGLICKKNAKNYWTTPSVYPILWTSNVLSEVCSNAVHVPCWCFGCFTTWAKYILFLMPSVGRSVCDHWWEYAGHEDSCGLHPVTAKQAPCKVWHKDAWFM